jgi:uncharacterized protein YecT (DUF1311 family)
MLMTRLVMLVLLHSFAALQAQDTQRLQDAVKAHVGPADDKPPMFRHAFTDLDGDGVLDAVVLMSGSEWCGSGGCNMLVFRGTKAGFTFLCSSTVTSEPIRVSTEKSFGWKTLIVSSRGKGDVLMPFDGKRYPSNPSLQPKASAAVVTAAEVVIQSSSPRSKWLYREELIYRDQPRSSGSVTLQDGRDLQLRFGGAGSLTADDIGKWPRGKRIHIAYSEEDGAVLVDPDSGKFALILLGLEEHPIDIMRQQCLRGAGATSEIVDCYREELGYWDKEMNRFYSLLMASLSSEQKAAVQTAQREWLTFRDAQRAAAAKVFTEGTISRITTASEVNNVTREQAQRLARYLAQ